jgi:transposase
VARRRIEVSDVVEVLVHWQAGRTVKQIVRTTGMARNTVRKYLAAAERAGLKREPVLPKAELAAWVSQACPELGGEIGTDFWAELRGLHDEIAEALKHSTMATVWQRLHDAGRVRCSVITFRRFVRKVMREGNPARITVIRPPAALGEVAEVDFGVLGMWVDPVTQLRRRLWLFLMVLAASRHMFIRPVWTLDLKTWIRCHVEGFEFFGSVPMRIVLDNLKDGVVKPSLYDPKLNRTYAEMAQFYGTLLDPCRLEKPRDKPVVERNVPYARDSFWSGRHFGTFDSILRAAPIWCMQTAGTRVHRTTRQRPIDLFELERKVMLPLPAGRFEIVSWHKVKVPRDIHINVRAALYSVPWRYQGQWLQACLRDKTVEVFDGEELVKTHIRVPAGQRQTDWADYPLEKAAFFVRNAPWCRKYAEHIGPNTTSVVASLLEDGAIHHLRQAQAILRLADVYPVERMEAACRIAALADGQFMTVRNLLTSGRDQLDIDVIYERANSAPAFLHGPEVVLAGGIR